MFYLLSFLTGVLECGWIAFGVVHGYPLWQILCFPLAYHMGNLFPKPFSLSRKCLALMSVFSLLTGVFILPPHTLNGGGTAPACMALFCLSAVFQSVRSEFKSDKNTLLKRVFRVLGFAAAPIAAVFPATVIVAASGIALLAVREYKGEVSVSKLSFQKGFSVVMLFHQLHYFFYAHTVLAAVSIFLNNAFSPKDVVLAFLLFCGTWVTYMSVEPIVSKLGLKTLTVFYAGHIGISLLLLAMNFFIGKPLFILLWLITGFGGGVVYTVSAKARAVGCYEKDSMTIFENIGHTLGLLSAAVVATVFGSLSVNIMLVMGAVSAVLTVISMSVIT